MLREKRSSAFKRKVSLEAVRERKTINEIASEFGVHPAQVSKWRKQLLDGIDSIFEAQSRNRKILKEKSDHEKYLHEKIGRLTMELDWLKKKLDHV